MSARPRRLFTTRGVASHSCVGLRTAPLRIEFLSYNGKKVPPRQANRDRDSPAAAIAGSAERATTPLAERQLVDQCLAGDEAAWNALFKAVHAPLVTVTKSLLTSTTDDDLANEVVGRVWYSLVAEPTRKLGRFDPARGCCLVTFLTALAKNEIRQHFRTEHRRRVRERKASRREARSSSLNLVQTPILFDEFLESLTPREREFLQVHLEDPKLPAEPFTDANAWQLKYRIRKKLTAYLAVGSA